MPQLRALIDDDISSIRKYVEKVPVIITEIFYNTFMGIMFVLFYISAPQGRVGGLQSLKMLHVTELLKQGYCLNKEFKTTESFEYQPVILSEGTRELLDVYLELLRPFVNNKRKIHRDDKLWLNYNGHPLTGIGRLIKRWHLKNNLNINTTRLRRIVETETEELLKDGKISTAQRASIAVISGHGVGTARDYYVRSDMDADVKRAKAAFGMSSNLDNIIDPTRAAVYVTEPWGAEHPSPSKSTRAEWSEAEVKYLTDLVETISAERYGKSTNMMAECLKRIRKDSNARVIFHERHVLTTDRLRSGYRNHKNK